MNRLLWTTPAAALFLAGTCLSTPAFSQSLPVTVDLSVLNDGGYGPLATPGYAGGSMALEMPGPVAPKSSYFGPSVSVSNPILSAPSTPVVTQTASEADSQVEAQMSSQSTTASELTTADVVPPPPPEPVAVTVPAEETTAPEVTTAAAIPEAPESIPEAPAEPAVSSAASSTTAVALEPTVPDAPPPAPEAPKVTEMEAASTETTTADASSSSTETASTEMAAASSLASGMSAAGHALQIVFGEADSKLPGSVENKLNAIVEQVKDTDTFRIQLLAYAGGESLSASKARRLSLSRALSVRSFFIENGVRSTRIDVRALGDKTDEQPVNRVDINIIER